MDQDTDVHLKWNNHHTTLLSVFSSLLGNENLVDCTISAEGQCFKAHRIILSACSPYFEFLFSQHYEKHPIVILPDVKFQILKALVEFMYSGEIKVPQNKLYTVLELAETLQIKGLSVTDESEMMEDLGPKRKNQSAIVCDQQGLKKHLHERGYGSKVKHKGVSSLNPSEKECYEDADSHLLTYEECAKNSSKSVSAENTNEESAMSQDITDSETVSDFQYSSPTKRLKKSNTRVPGTLLNSVSNILDSSQLPGSSKETVGEQRMLSENVTLTHSTSKELRTSERVGMCGERPTVDLLPEVKQEEPDDIKGDSIDEIILDDDDADESDNYDQGSGGDNSSTIGGRVIPEESFSGQGFCNVEEYRDTYFVKPASILPNRHKCDACGRTYQHYSSLCRHRKVECGKEPQFRCPKCFAMFFHKHVLKEHMSNLHSLSGFKL